jgi:CubicO group peptidase (beta-lactamase class C family)
MSSLLRFLSASVLLNATAVLAQLQCPPLGPILPAPTNLDAIRALAQPLQAQLANETVFDSSATALSVGLLSIHDPTPLLSVHITPTSYNQSGTHNVTGDTIYAIASVTKLFTAISILQLEGKINLADSVLKYVPRLAQLSPSHDPVLEPDWSTVTIESMLSHLSGIANDSKWRPATRRSSNT